MVQTLGEGRKKQGSQKRVDPTVEGKWCHQSGTRGGSGKKEESKGGENIGGLRRKKVEEKVAGGHSERAIQGQEPRTRRDRLISEKKSLHQRGE